MISRANEKSLPSALSCLRAIVVDDLRRYGNSGDGGYLLPASRVKETDGILSFGLANDWTLEKELRDLRPEIPIHVYDHTVSGDGFRQDVKSAVRDTAVGLGKLSLFQTPYSDVLSRIHSRRKIAYRGYQTFVRRARSTLINAFSIVTKKIWTPRSKTCLRRSEAHCIF